MKIHLPRHGAATLAGGLAILLAAALPAAAVDVIYQNSTVVGTNAAFDIGTAAIANSFTANPGSVATSIDFLTWVYYQDGEPTSVDWAISNGDPFTGGTTFAHGTAATPSTFLHYVDFGIYNLFDTVISIGSVALNGGDYWLTLTNGHTTGDTQPLAWDLNGGPSLAFQSVPGAPGPIRTDSNAFEILGTVGAVSPVAASVPEPAAWALMLLGFGGLGAALRARRRTLAALPRPQTVSSTFADCFSQRPQSALSSALAGPSDASLMWP